LGAKKLAKPSTSDLPSEDDEDEDSFSSEGEGKFNVFELLRENRKLQAELDRYVDHDRELLRRERRQLEDYRRSVQEERRQRAAAEAAAKKAAAAEKQLTAEVEGLRQQLEAQAAAHDEEVNELYEQLLEEKQQVLNYCDQGQKLYGALC
jgi:chromosome segregation ATPase